MISQGNRVEAAREVWASHEFGFALELGPLSPEAPPHGHQSVFVNPPTGQIVVGTYWPGELYKDVVITPGRFVGAGVFEGKFYEGDVLDKDMANHWKVIEDNLYYLLKAWLKLLPVPPPGQVVWR
jgi:hypothetical protein